MDGAVSASWAAAMLDQAALAYQNVPVWVLVTGHCLSCVSLTRGYTPYWLVSWLVGFVSAFGGGMTSALLLQSPGIAAIGLFASNEVGLCYTLAWWAYNYFPGGWVARLAELPPVRCACNLARVILRANTVVQRVNAAVKVHPAVVAAPLVLGTLGGCGGRLLVDAFGYCAGYHKGPTQLSHPGHSLRSAALAALLQYVLVHVTGLLTSQQGLGLVISIYVAHSLASDLTGQPCDYTAVLGSLFHKITLIPAPAEVDAAPAPAEAPAVAPAIAPVASPVDRPAARPGRVSRRGRRRTSGAAGSPLMSGGELSADEGMAATAYVTTRARRRSSRLIW